MSDQKKFYRVVGLCELLDGTVVSGDFCGDSLSSSLFSVHQIEEGDLVGDREVCHIIDGGKLLIDASCLQELPDYQSKREFDSKNPWGKFVTESTTSNESFSLSYAVMERAISVNLREIIGFGRSLYSMYLPNTPQNLEELRKIADVHLGSRSEGDELVFALKRLKKEAGAV